MLCVVRRRLWDMNDNMLVARVMLASKVRALAFNDDGSIVAAGLADGTLTCLRTKCACVFLIC